MTALAAGVSRPAASAGRAKGLARYGMGVLGPASVSVAHFAASLLLLHSLPPGEFGLFAFVLVAVQFCFGLSNALIGTPYTVSANQGAIDNAPYFHGNGLLAIAAFMFCGAVAALMGAGWLAPLFGLFAFLTVLRWFLRSYFYAHHLPGRVVVSDLAYALTLFGGLGVAAAVGLTLGNAILATAVAALLGLACVGTTMLGRQLVAFGKRATGYHEIWRQQSRYALIGVVATEAATNAHIWLVTLVAGPTAFAPLAAASLLFRPLLLTATSLTQLERPVMSRAIAAGRKPESLRITAQFRLALFVVWGLTGLVAIAVLAWVPELIIPASYDRDTVLLAASAWGVIHLILAWRTPDSVLLQAAGRFRILAGATVAAAATSLVGVTVLLLLLPPVWSLVGVIAGQAAMSLCLASLLRDWRKNA